MKNFREFVNNLVSHNGKVFLLFLLIGFILYANVINGRFLFDDELLIVRNTVLRDFDLVNFFKSSTTSGAFIGGNFYRPLQLILFSLLYNLFGLQQIPFHLASILLHASSAYLFFQLLIKLKITRWPALVAAFIFLVHPVMTQAVAYVSGVADPLGLLFFLGAMHLLFDLKKGKENLRVAGIIILSVCALLTKESYIVAGPILFAASVLIIRRKKMTDNTNLAAIIVTVINIIYAVLRSTVINFTGVIGATRTLPEYSANVFIRLSSFIGSLFEYVILLIFPAQLYYEKPFVAATTIVSFKGIFGLVLIGALITAAIYSYKRKYFTVVFGLAWTALAFIPYAGIIPINAIYLEHWLYLPLLGILIALAFVVMQLKLLENKIFVIGLSIVLALLCIRTVARNYEWSDALIFFQNEINHNPGSARIYNNMAIEYFDRKNIAASIGAYKKSLELDPTYAETWHNLGYAYEISGDINSALQAYVKSLEVDRNFIYTYVKLANIFEKTGYHDKAVVMQGFIERLQKGEEINVDELKQVFSSN